MIHWASQYIGKPWESGAQGPDAFDCYGFFRHVQREHFGIEVQIVNVDAGSIAATVRAFDDKGRFDGWRQVDEPADGDAVLMSQARHPSHIGVWIIDRALGINGALHCVEGAGVIYSTPQALRHDGWGKQTFWRNEKWA
jgi:hypothetical protein